jgi:hypothetical protein
MEVRKDRFKTKITSPYTGQEYILRRVSMKLYFKEIGILPVSMPESIVEELASLAKDMRTRVDAEEKDDALARQTVEFCLKNGVADPKIWYGEGECPDGSIARGDLADDADWVAARVIEFSFDFAGLKDLAKFFRDSGTVADRPDGEAVRDAAILPTASGNA